MSVQIALHVLHITHRFRMQTEEGMPDKSLCLRGEDNNFFLGY